LSSLILVVKTPETNTPLNDGAKKIFHLAKCLANKYEWLGVPRERSQAGFANLWMWGHSEEGRIQGRDWRGKSPFTYS
jgi:hypothetical protein